ncbi:MAG TPA: hypothetical protein VED46_14290 [Alphaproteobacteria bacterium]|nr:hypothetical protein [Alphaproteobacteria bacterium]
MVRHRIAASATIISLLTATALITMASVGPAEAADMKRTITMVAIEPKGGTTIDKEPFPTAALPEGEGYELKPPDDKGRWEVSTYRWEPNQIFVNQGDEVTLKILGVNGKEHPTVIEGYDIEFTVKRGQLTRRDSAPGQPALSGFASTGGFPHGQDRLPTSG